MGAAAVFLVLGSAALHVIWNAAARSASGNLRFMWHLAMGGAVAGLLLANTSLSDVDWARAAPYLLATVAIHACYFTAVGRAYEHGRLAASYAAARGFAIVLTATAALLFWHQRVPALGWLGIALVVVGCLLAVSGDLATRGVHRWILGVGLLIACYSLVDSRAVQLVDPVAYIALLFCGAALLMTPWALRAPPSPAAWRALAAGVVSLLSYLLMLYAYRLAPVAPVLAVRQAAAPVFAVTAGWFALRERPTRTVLLGVLAVVVGGALAVLG